ARERVASSAARPAGVAAAALRFAVSSLRAGAGATTGPPEAPPPRGSPGAERFRSRCARASTAVWAGGGWRAPWGPPPADRLGLDRLPPGVGYLVASEPRCE